MKLNQTNLKIILAATGGVLALLLSACAAQMAPAPPVTISNPEYVIGPGDTLQVFVWRNPELSLSIPVRPDGRISTPLVEELTVANKTPAQVAREIERRLSTYLKDPLVTVIVTNFIGPYNQQIRVLGAATRPQVLPYRANMTVLDVIIAVGGLTNVASGNKATISRIIDKEVVQFSVRLDDLIRDGDIHANVEMSPGDILIIPESWF
jgi:polysaccharide export outer membrane protein